jgi:hypothetical protein
MSRDDPGYDDAVETYYMQPQGCLGLAMMIFVSAILILFVTLGKALR